MFVLVQRILPKKLIGRAVYFAVRWRFAPFKNLLIGWFIKHFEIDMGEAAEPDPRAYANFNAFFTRALREGARPLEGRDGETLLSPADGRLTQWGDVNQGRLIQAKGLDYLVDELLGYERPFAADFNAGQFATIYLAPHNYHRVHMPVAGQLRGMTLIPGQRFAVNAATVSGMANLFPGNERLVCWFEAEPGPLALVLVSAFNVATMSTPWAGEVTASGSAPRLWSYEGPTHRFRRGDEVGRFNLGSTVVMVLAERALAWRHGLAASAPVRMGEQLAELR